MEPAARMLTANAKANRIAVRNMILVDVMVTLLFSLRLLRGPEGRVAAKPIAVFYSTSVIVLMRSVQSPPLSWTISFSFIVDSEISVIRPKFWPR